MTAPHNPVERALQQHLPGGYRAGAARAFDQAAPERHGLALDAGADFQHGGRLSGVERAVATGTAAHGAGPGPAAGSPTIDLAHINPTELPGWE